MSRLTRAKADSVRRGLLSSGGRSARGDGGHGVDARVHSLSHNYNATDPHSPAFTQRPSCDVRVGCGVHSHGEDGSYSRVGRERTAPSIAAAAATGLGGGADAAAPAVVAAVFANTAAFARGKQAGVTRAKPLGPLAAAAAAAVAGTAGSGGGGGSRKKAAAKMAAAGAVAGLGGKRARTASTAWGHG